MQFERSRMLENHGDGFHEARTIRTPIPCARVLEPSDTV